LQSLRFGERCSAVQNELVEHKVNAEALAALDAKIKEVELLIEKNEKWEVRTVEMPKDEFGDGGGFRQITLPVGAEEYREQLAILLEERRVLLGEPPADNITSTPKAKYNKDNSQSSTRLKALTHSCVMNALGNTADTKNNAPKSETKLPQQSRLEALTKKCVGARVSIADSPEQEHKSKAVLIALNSSPTKKHMKQQVGLGSTPVKQQVHAEVENNCLVLSNKVNQPSKQTAPTKSVPSRFARRMTQNDDQEAKKKRLEEKTRQADARRQAMAAERKAKAAKHSKRILGRTKEKIKSSEFPARDAVPEVFRTRPHGEDAPVCCRDENLIPTREIGGFTRDSGWD